jgi:hypothetical protein
MNRNAARPHKRQAAPEEKMKRLSRSLSAAAAVALAASAAAAAPAARADAPAPRNNSCFLSRDWTNWTASPSGDVLYLRVNNHDVYEVGLTPGSHVHKYPGSFLVNQVRGSSWICSPLDLDLTLSDDVGMRLPLIARSMKKLTPAEVAAIPKKYRP